MKTPNPTEVDALWPRLTRRIREGAERYAHTLPELETEVAALTEKVIAHLETMGCSCNWN